MRSAIRALAAIFVLSTLLLPACRRADKPASSTDRAAVAFPRTTPVLRKDAFFGLHFDLHPQATDTSLGADISEDNIRNLLERVRPDYVQYDCKGHAGWAGYPTAVGWASPGLVKDSLAMWRKATRDVGVGLFIHYSGVWDSKAVAEHPDWARVGPDGKPDPNATSVFGPYVDELLIPQLNEVAQKYGLDGVWADGECWAAQLDWSPRALAAWTKETGHRDAPKDRTDPRWLDWKMFHRRAFERYLARWTDAFHAANPALHLTSTGCTRPSRPSRSRPSAISCRAIIRPLFRSTGPGSRPAISRRRGCPGTSWPGASTKARASAGRSSRPSTFTVIW